MPATLTVNALDSNLSVVKSTIDDLFRVGDLFTYTLVVSNVGPQDAICVMPEDTLPDQVTFIAASEGCTFLEGVVTRDVGDLAISEMITYTIVVTASDDGIAGNVAIVSSDFSTDPDLNNKFTLETEIMPTYF